MPLRIINQNRYRLRCLIESKDEYKDQKYFKRQIVENIRSIIGTNIMLYSSMNRKKEKLNNNGKVFKEIVLPEGTLSEYKEDIIDFNNQGYTCHDGHLEECNNN